MVSNDYMEEFEETLYGDTIELKKEDKEYKKEEKRSDILLEFQTPPYESLMDKIRTEVSLTKTEERDTFLIMKFKTTEDAWELGYIKMGLDFWKMIEDVFINYKPKFYEIKDDYLKELKKIDFIGTVKLEGSELDGFIE